MPPLEVGTMAVEKLGTPRHVEKVGEVELQVLQTILQAWAHPKTAFRSTRMLTVFRKDEDYSG
jgi:hypothetical protein